MYSKASFIESNPNPIIVLDKKQRSIVYINLSARMQFSQLEAEGLNSEILQGIDGLFSVPIQRDSCLTLMVREVLYRKSVFEQQLFTIAGEDAIFIHMHNITHYKNIEKSSSHYMADFEKLEKELRMRQHILEDELKKSIELINSRRQQERVALRAAKIAAWSWHVPCDLITWDESLTELLSLPSSICSGNFQVILNAIHPNDRQRVSAELKEAWINNTHCDIKFRIIKEDHSLVELSLRGGSYMDSHDKLIGLAGICLPTIYSEVM